MMPSGLMMADRFGLLEGGIGSLPCLKDRHSDPDKYRIQSQLESWLADTAAVCCARASMEFPIPDEERALVANAVPKRQAEFIAGRWCAHRALEAICRPSGRILVGELGGPQWPAGISGSITHESGLCLAVVARESQFNGIGIDLLDKRRDAEIDEVSGLILSETELGLCHVSVDDTLCLMLAFSAKEAVVKAISRRIGRFLDMREIELSVEARSFSASVTGFPHEIRGRWASVGSFFLTLAVIADEKKRGSRFHFGADNEMALSPGRLE